MTLFASHHHQSRSRLNRLCGIALPILVAVSIAACTPHTERCDPDVLDIQPRLTSSASTDEPDTPKPTTLPPETEMDTEVEVEANEAIEFAPFPGVIVAPHHQTVSLQAWVCLDTGWLEQIACSPGTREHESLLVVRAIPSQIHAAMLAAGFEPGAPGRWRYEHEEFSFIAPTGSAVEVLVRYTDEAGTIIEESIRMWIHDHHDRETFPDVPWIFAGSRLITDDTLKNYYVADASGSIIGLVTFGDEVIGFSQVLADQAAVHAPEWEVDTDAIPPVGTEVTLIIAPSERSDQ